MPSAIAAIPAWFYTAIYYAAVVYGVYSSVQQRRGAKRRAKEQFNDSLQDRLNMVSTADGARSRVYGLVRNVDGVLFKATHGANSEYYTLVVALAGHECESIEKIYFNDQELELQSDGAGGYWVMTEPYVRHSTVSGQADMTTVGTTASVTLPYAPVSGSVQCFQYLGADPEGGFPLYQMYTPSSIAGNVVTCSPVDPSHTSIQCSYQYVNDIPKARIWKYLGTSTQDVGSDLLASRFPTLINTGTNPTTGLPNDDRFAGICLLVVELQFDQDAFPTGVPTVTALVKGAKVHDPRTGLTEWSQNPALIARDWSLYAYGGGCSSSEIVEAAFLAAANACDVETGFVTAAGTETRPLYQCDTVCKLDSPPDQGWLAEIVESMAGKWGWAGGQLTVVAGVNRAPVATITEDWISNAADISLVKDVPINEAVNVYRPTIANADAPVNGTTGETAAYAMAAMPAVSSAAYIEADGMELPREVTLGGVTHNVHAQHICGVFMRDARYGLTLSLPCKMHAWQLELFDVVRVTLPIFGFVNSEFEVIGWRFDPEKGINLVLKQISAAIFDPAASFDLPNASLNSSMVLPWVVPDIENFAVVDAPEDGTQQCRALVTWDAITAENVRQSGQVEVQYREITTTYSESDWKIWPEAGSSTSTIVPGLRAQVPYLFRARAVNTLRVRGAWCTQVLYSPTVPLIDTGQLAPGSVTDVVQGTLDTTVYGGGYVGDLPGQVDVTPTTDSRLIVTVTGTLRATNSTGSVRIVRALASASYVVVAGGVGSGGGGGGDVRRNIANSETWEQTMTCTFTLDATAGVTYGCGMHYSDHISATISSELTNVLTRVEVIKR